MSNTQPMQNTKVFASRIQDPTRAQVCSTKDKDNAYIISKYLKSYKAWIHKQSTKDELKFKLEYFKALKESNVNKIKTKY